MDENEKNMELLQSAISKLLQLNPESAGPEDIGMCEELLSLLESGNNRAIIFKLMIKLGSFYLEDRTGDRAQRVQQALEIYRRARSMVSSETESNAWNNASLGLANAYMIGFEISNNEDWFNKAEHTYSELCDAWRSKGDIFSLGSTLISYATLLARAEGYDQWDCRERAVMLMREAVNILSPESIGDSFQPTIYSKALYTLGASLLNKKGGFRSEYIDEAIQAFQEALVYRPKETDPAGRCRVLRALAKAYPGWSGAESIAAAQVLSEKALLEAEEIEQAYLGRRASGWVEFIREQSALYADFDNLQNNDEALRKLEAQIDRHKEAVRSIPCASMPALWAQWQAGIARLYSQLGRFGNEEMFKRASTAFQKALDALANINNPVMERDILKAYGMMNHESGNWEGSLTVNAMALDLGRDLYKNAGTEESRWQELQSIRVVSQIAAYAAGRLGRVDDAIELAERGLACWLVDHIIAAEILHSDTPIAIRQDVGEANAQLMNLTHQIQALDRSSSKGRGRDAMRKLHDYLGTHQGSAGIGFRFTNVPDPEAEYKLDKKKSAFYKDIRVTRKKLHDAFKKAISMDEGVKPMTLEKNHIFSIAKKNRAPLVYLLSTTWGSSAFIVNGNSAEQLRIDGLNSDDTNRLVWGTKKTTGYLKAALGTERTKLGSALKTAIKTLKDLVFEPLRKWGFENGISRFTILGLGSIGMLPLHAAALEKDLVVSLAPSARSLEFAISSKERSLKRPLSYGTVAYSGDSSEREPLHFTDAEVAYIRSYFEQNTQTPTLPVLYSARIETFREIAHKSTHLHISCHGQFRPSAPFESSIQIGANEEMQMFDLMWPSPALQDTQLVYLASCSSAGEEYWELPDEAIGFPAMMIGCGAACIIGAAWEVDDAATCLINYRFIQSYFESRDAAGSLAEAQMWLRDASPKMICCALKELIATLPSEYDKSRRVLRSYKEEISEMSEPPFHEPEYYAAFVCMGI